MIAWRGCGPRSESQVNQVASGRGAQKMWNYPSETLHRILIVQPLDFQQISSVQTQTGASSYYSHRECLLSLLPSPSSFVLSPSFREQTPSAKTLNLSYLQRKRGIAEKERERGRGRERESRFLRNGLGSGEAVHWWDIMGDDGGQADRVLQPVRWSYADSRHAGQGHQQAAGLRVCGLLRPLSPRPGSSGKAYNRRKDGM